MTKSLKVDSHNYIITKCCSEIIYVENLYYDCFFLYMVFIYENHKNIYFNNFL